MKIIKITDRGGEENINKYHFISARNPNPKSTS